MKTAPRLKNNRSRCQCKKSDYPWSKKKSNSKYRILLGIWLLFKLTKFGALPEPILIQADASDTNELVKLLHSDHHLSLLCKYFFLKSPLFREATYRREILGNLTKEDKSAAWQTIVKNCIELHGFNPASEKGGKYLRGILWPNNKQNKPRKQAYSYPKSKVQCTKDVGHSERSNIQGRIKINRVSENSEKHKPF
uniref:Uncharacterized protein n=1 Tax=Romanomermis culicivorax TaxID=13658 RepID=A0A915KCC1_ROMCU